MNQLANRLFAGVGLSVLLALPMSARLNAQTHPAPATGVSQARVEELQKLHFGMFICWSFSTFSGKEWTPGVTDIHLFAAKDCDTDQWAKTAKEAGMGYILFLTKHHDGFCLWDTKTTERKVTKAPLGRDVLAELKKSCDKVGIKLALYFSEGEFKDNKEYHPGGYTAEMKKAQLKELLTQYGPIEYIWFDHAQTDGGLSHEDTTNWCKQFQPDCFIGYNNGAASGDIRLGEEGSPSALTDVSGAGFNREQMRGYAGYRLAEFTYPILQRHDGGAMWFYSLPKHDQLCLSPEKIYADYLGAVKFGNIYSLDLGPDYNGKLRDVDVKTLQQVGRWIRGEDKPQSTPVPRGKTAPVSSTGHKPPGTAAERPPSGADKFVWGGAVSGLQLGIAPIAGPDGVALALFDGTTLQVNVQVRNAGKSPLRFLAPTFGCGAIGPGGAIPVTQLILTPSAGGEALSITYQGHNHLKDADQLDAGDLKYYTTVLAPGKALSYPYPVRFTPGEERATSWQRTGKSNILPAGKYQMRAVFSVDTKVSPWNGEATSGAVEVEIPPSAKQ